MLISGPLISYIIVRSTGVDTCSLIFAVTVRVYCWASWRSAGLIKSETFISLLNVNLVSELFSFSTGIWISIPLVSPSFVKTAFTSGAPSSCSVVPLKTIVLSALRYVVPRPGVTRSSVGSSLGDLAKKP